MSGFLVEQGATVICAHGGQAMATVVSPRVRLSGRPAVTLPPPWTVAGCALPPAAGGPCVTAMWNLGTTRVRSSGQPLVVQGGSATCVPTGVALTVLVTQLRVRAS